MRFKCRGSNCVTSTDKWMPVCPSCGMAGSMVPFEPKMARVEKSDRKTLMDAPPLDGIRISTGIPGLDRVLGTDWRTKKQGVYVPSLVLFAGTAGSGKTTLLMKMAAKVKTNRMLYLSTEQTISEIRENAERCGLTPQDMKRIEAERISTLEEAIESMKKSRCQVAVIDSMNELLDPVHDTNDLQMNLVQMTNALKQDCESNRRAIFLIAHMNKKDEISGVQRIQHIVSTVMMITHSKRGPSFREVTCPKKHRWGSTSEVACFVMSENGLVEPLPQEELYIDATDA